METVTMVYVFVQSFMVLHNFIVKAETIAWG